MVRKTHPTWPTGVRRSLRRQFPPGSRDQSSSGTEGSPGPTGKCSRQADHQGGMTPIKTFGKFAFLAAFFGLVLWGAPAVAGQAGTVSCTTPDCGYQEYLKIGGGMRSPAVTGYCRSTKKFVRLKLKSWDEYRKITPACPDCPEPIQPIYDGGQVGEIPCPKCGNLTLHYKKTLMFD
jgi:hypothetical protein